MNLRVDEAKKVLTGIAAKANRSVSFRYEQHPAIVDTRADDLLLNRFCSRRAAAIIAGSWGIQDTNRNGYLTDEVGSKLKADYKTDNVVVLYFYDRTSTRQNKTNYFAVPNNDNQDGCYNVIYYGDWYPDGNGNPVNFLPNIDTAGRMIAHEILHLYGAYDEYKEAGNSCGMDISNPWVRKLNSDAVYRNGNDESCPTRPHQCIMGKEARDYRPQLACPFTLASVGLGDIDHDGILDPDDRPTAPPPPPPPSGTDNAGFVSEGAPLDDTVLTAGQTFTKSWTIRNTGTTTWGAGYRFAFDGESQMNGANVDAPTVRPGQNWTVVVTLKAPTTANTYRGYWRMEGPKGKFGTRPYVQIKINATVPPSVPVWEGNLDAPANGQTVRGIQVISGWGWDKSGKFPVKAVEIFINGEHIANGEYGIPRPDLGRNIGYRFSWDTSRWGGQDVSVVVRLSSGDRWADWEKTVHVDAVVGQGSSRQNLFIDAYNRNGGSATMGAPVNIVHDWGGIKIQDFAGGSYGPCAIIDDEANGVGAWVVRGAIWQKFIDIGGPDAPPGRPRSDERIADASPYGTTGYVQDFERGHIIASGSNVFWVINQIDQKYLQLGASSGIMGFLLSDEHEYISSVSGIHGWANVFEGGHIFHTNELGTFYTTGAINQHYAAMGSMGSILGFPTRDPQAADKSFAGTTGFAQSFERGHMVSSNFGSFWAINQIDNKYIVLGGSAGIMGFLLSDEQETDSGASTIHGWFNNFEGGRIFHSNELGTYEVHGGVFNKYQAAGGVTGILGFPTSDEKDVKSSKGTTGKTNTFEGGTIFYVLNSGKSFVVSAPIAAKYSAAGSYAGTLGFPISDAYSYLGGTRQDFEGGSLTTGVSIGLTLNPTAVNGGASAIGTVTLVNAAPQGGVTIVLSSNNAKANVAAAITIPAGAKSKAFTVTTSAVTAKVVATITATLLDVKKTATLSIGNANISPTLANATFDAVKGSAFSRQLAGTDANGDTLTYRATVGTLPAGLTLSTSGLLSGTPTSVGSKVVTVEVSDGKGGTDTAQITIKVADVPAPSGPNFVVTVTADTDNGNYAANDISLREAIKFANANADASVITFDATVFGSVRTITLNGEEIELKTKLSIVGPSKGVIINANQQPFMLGVTVGDATLSNLTVTNAKDGSGLYNTGKLTLINCDVSGNINSQGIASNGVLTVTDSRITNNTIRGGIANDRGTLTLTRSVVSGNSSSSPGGGIFNFEGTVIITASTIANNTTESEGGAISNYRGALTIIDSTLAGNSAPNDDGGAIATGSNVTITGSTFSGNSALSGGAIFYNGNFAEAPLAISNSTFSGNSAANVGGAIYTLDGLTAIESCTITNNMAPAGKGGGLANYGASYERTEINNSIVAGNNGSDVAFVYGTQNTFLSKGHNLIGAGNAKAVFNKTGDKVGADAKLGPLQNNGGSTSTHALLVGSPAINTGATTLMTDQRGQKRPFGSADDIGAFESQTVAPPADLSVSLSPTTPFTGDTLTATVSPQAAGTTLAYVFSIKGKAVQSGSSNKLDLSKAGQGDKGDVVLCEVTATNSSGGKTTASAQVTVQNSAPIAISSKGTVPADTLKAFVLNAFDADGDALTYKRVGGPRSGVADIRVDPADGVTKLFYKSRPFYGGVDIIRFVAFDSSNKQSNESTLGINVLYTPPPPVNRAPIAGDTSIDTFVGTSVVKGLLGSDPDGDALTFRVVNNARYGSSVIRRDSDGFFKLFYTSLNRFYGDDRVTYLAVDRYGKESNVATVGIKFINRSPVALGNFVQVASGVEVSQFLFADDPDLDAITYRLVNNPRFGKGEIKLDPQGKWRFFYQSLPRYVGPDRITFIAIDAFGKESQAAAIDINVVRVGGPSARVGSGVGSGGTESGGGS